MTPARLEWLRFARTWRLPTMLIVSALVGLGGPPLAQLESSLLRGQEDLIVLRPPPTPIDSLRSFQDLWLQTGLIITVVTSAASLCAEQARGTAALLRSAVPAHKLLRTRYLVSWGLSANAMAVAYITAFYQTFVLHGTAPFGRIALSGLFLLVYLTFALSLMAFYGMTLRHREPVVGATIGTLILLALAGALDPIAAWLPGRLTSLAGRALTGDVVASDAISAVIGLTAAVLLLGAALRLSSRSGIGVGPR